MKIAIVTDSSCDIPQDLIKEHNVHILPIKVTLGDDEFLDGININANQIFEYVEKTGLLPKTASINPIEYEEKFREILNDYDAIIHISLSFGISSTGRNAQIAADAIGNGKVRIIDSKSLSSGLALLVLSASELIKKQIPLDDIVETLNETAVNLQTSFVINRLNYLYKGGRCNSLQLLGANLFKIKPKIEVKDGVMGISKKYIGKYDEVVIRYVTESITENPPLLENCFIAFPSQLAIIEDIKSVLKNAGFKNVYTNYASATITSHCGPDTIGIMYIKK